MTSTTGQPGSEPLGSGREYLRVSMDHSGQARSTSEQHDENRADAEALGVTLGEPYRDDSRSASRYATKVRDDFVRLMGDLRAGSFGAQVLWLWESSRGSRRVGEWVELIELCEQHGILIRVTTHGRFYDPRNPRDRRSLLEDAVDSEYESSKAAARSRRAVAAGLAAGRPHGVTPFGYRRRYDEHTRRLVAQEIDPVAGPVVAELYERLLRGESLRSIAAEFRDRGVEKVSGGAFSAAHLRVLALNPSYAGLRVQGQGKSVRHPQPGPERITKGQWPPIVPEATYYGVRARLTDPSRRTSRDGRARHLLSMIARCAECGSVLVATYRHGRRDYQCQARGCVKVAADSLDAAGERAMLAYLTRPDVYESLRAQDAEEGADRAALRDEIAAIRAELDELADAVGNGTVSVTLAARSEPRLLARLATAERRDQELATPAVLRGIVGPGEDIAERWADVAISARRELARTLLAPEMLGMLVLHPRTNRGPYTQPVEERIEFRKSNA